MGDLSWRFDNNEYRYIKEVLDSGFASGTSGSMNKRLEEAFARIFGQKYAVTFNSGTTTLHAALWAAGVRYGDEVLVTPLTVISCMNAILYCDAIPVFVDVDPDTFLMDAEDMARRITDRTKAVMAVNLYGQTCDMTRVMEIANRHNLFVLEDNAQNYLGTHKGHYAGTFGHASSWSFENSKHITTGDGGIITCDDEHLATTIRKLGTQGFRNATAVSGQIRVSKDVFQNPSYKRHDAYGFMYRLPEVAAALGLAQVEKMELFVNKRIQMGTKYLRVIGESGIDWLRPQKTPAGDVNSYYTFAARFSHPEVSWQDFRKRFMENGGDGIYAAWALAYQEDSIPEILQLLELKGLGNRLKTEGGLCPNAERIQPQLMQFTTNQKDESEMDAEAQALQKTIRQFS